MKSPQTSLVKAELGEEITGALVTRAVAEACLMSGSKMEPALQAMIASSLINDYWHFKMDEIMFVLSEGVKGRFVEPGKPAIYGQLNMQTIHQWMQTYDMERMNKIEGQHELNKSSWGNPSDRSPAPRLAKDIFQEAVDQRVEKRIDAYKEKIRENEG